MRILFQLVFQIMASEKLVCQKIFLQRIWFCCQWIFLRIVTLVTNKMVECIPWNKIVDSYHFTIWFLVCLGDRVLVDLLTWVHCYEKVVDSQDTFLLQILSVEKNASRELYFRQSVARSQHQYQPPYIKNRFSVSRIIKFKILHQKFIPLAIIFRIESIFIICILIKILQTIDYQIIAIC